MTTTSWNRPVPRARRIARALMVASVLMGVVVLPVPASAARPGLVAVDEIISPMDSRSSRHLVADVPARRLFEIGRIADREGMQVVVYDLDRLKRLATIDVPGAFSDAGGGLSAIDELRHRLYFVYPVGSALNDLGPAEFAKPVVRDAARTTFGIAVIDTKRMTLIGTRSLPQLQPVVPNDQTFGNGIGLKGFTYFSNGREEKLYLLSQVPAGVGLAEVSAHTVFVHEVDVAHLLDQTSDPVAWTIPVPNCPMAMARDVAAPILRLDAADVTELFIPCRAGSLLQRAQPAETSGMVRLHVTRNEGGDVTSTDSELFPISGNFTAGHAVLDRISRRFALVSEGAGGEIGAWVFDAITTSYIGFTSIPFAVHAFGFDEAYGRLYALSGFIDPETNEQRVWGLAASLRSPGADQGQTSLLEATVSTGGRIVVDPIRRALFAESSRGYSILGDRIPPDIQLPGADPDLNTVDVAEGAQTAVNFLGGVQAFGARVRWVRGVGGVTRNANALGDPALPYVGTGSLLPAQPAPGTRDIHLARVFGATLTSQEASAKVTGAERDDETDTDLGNWTSWVNRWGGPDLTGQRWPYEVTACTDFGNADDQRSAEGYGASADCARASGEVRAEAIARAHTVEDAGFAVAESVATTRIYRDPKRGIVARSTAEATGVDLMGLVGIGRVRSVAETWATGRPESSNGFGAASRYVRTIDDVRVLDPVSGEVLRVCDVGCDLDAVADAIHQALGTRVRVEFPEPDAAAAKGTPGGYEALVVRSLEQQGNEAAVNEETEIRLEVPAMVITQFSDGRVPSRVVLSLAGVAAESHYGIFMLPDLGPLTPPGLGVPDIDFPPAFVPGVDLTPPGLGFGDDPTGPPPPSVQRVVDGLRVIVTSPVQALRAAGLWGLFVAPLVMLLRRRALAGRP